MVAVFLFGFVLVLFDLVACWIVLLPYCLCCGLLLLFVLGPWLGPLFALFVLVVLLKQKQVVV